MDHQKQNSQHGGGTPVSDVAAIEIDPVCGMKVKLAKPAPNLEYEGKTIYFCCKHCLAKFTANPGLFTGKTTPAAQAKSAAPGAIFTCPMHPEVRQVGPGPCPKCGMALEPETVSADAGPNLELIDMTQRFWIGLARKWRNCRVPRRWRTRSGPNQRRRSDQGIGCGSAA